MREQVAPGKNVGWRQHQMVTTEIDCPHDEPCDCGPLVIAEMCDYDEDDWPCETVQAYRAGLTVLSNNLPAQVVGIDYTPEGIERLRQELVEMRDRTMADWPDGILNTVVYTHTIVLLGYLKDLVQACGNANP